MPLKLAALVLLACATLLPKQANANDADATWRFELSTDHHADALRLADMGSDDAVPFLSPRRGRNLAYVEDQALLARRQGDWTFGLLARSSATLVASQDSLDLAAALERKTSPATSRAWAVDARFAAFSGAGLVVERRFAPAAGWQAQASAQWLQLSRWRERRLVGDVRLDAASNAYGFDLVSRQRDDHLRFPFQTPVERHGWGTLFGAALSWQGQGLDAQLAVQDLGWLQWRRLPQEDASLSTQTQAVDADGFLIYKPLVQGQNSQASTRHWQNGRWALQAGWLAQPHTHLALGLQTRPGFGALPQISAQRQWGALTARAQWQFHEQRLGLSIGWRGWQLSAAADRLGRGARSQAFSLAYQRAH